MFDRKIKVKTLYLPKDDHILSFILSNGDLTVLDEQTSFTKDGLVITVVKYEDHSEIEGGAVHDYLQRIANGEKSYDIMSEPEDIDEDYKEDESFIAPQKKKGRSKKDNG